MFGNNSVKRSSSWSAHCASGIVVSAFLLGFLATASFTSAETLEGQLLATFQPQPASPYISEFIWNGSELYDGPGATGTGFGTIGAGDGNAAVNLQFSPGLEIISPFVISDVPGGFPSTSESSTTFYDATLDIIPIFPKTMGLPSAGSPVTGGALGPVFVQPLGAANFNIWSTKAGVADSTAELLLSGKIDSAYLTGILNSGSGGVISATVTYTGGKILTALGVSTVTGDLSWSLLNVTPKFHLTGGELASFSANAVGQFSAVPEPSTLVLLGMGALAVAGWLWRKRFAVSS